MTGHNLPVKFEPFRYILELYIYINSKHLQADQSDTSHTGKIPCKAERYIYISMPEIVTVMHEAYTPPYFSIQRDIRI